MRLRANTPFRLVTLFAVAAVTVVTAATASAAPVAVSAGDVSAGAVSAGDVAADAPIAVIELRADGTEVEVFSARASAARRGRAASSVPRSLPNKTRYYVESHLPRKTAWPYKRAIKSVDKLTRSSVKYGHCPQITAESPDGCVKFNEKQLAANVIGVASWWGDGRVVIDMNRTFRKHSLKLRYSALVHELGHAFGLDHNPSCASVMYWSSECMVGKAFTPAERRHLRTQ